MLNFWVVLQGNRKIIIMNE